MAADIGALTTWSTTAGSNQPDSSDSITNLDDNLRQIQATIRTYLANKGADIASASTVDLSTATGNYVHVTGTTTITALGTVSAGMRFLVVFDGALTLTHNGTSLILPGAANITTVAGDRAEFVSLGSGNWRCMWYQTANGVIGGVSAIAYDLGVTGSSATTVSAKLNEFVSIKDFGAVGNGTDDDLAAFNAMIASLNAGDVTKVYIPSGTYALSDNPDTITASNWEIEGDNALINFSASSTTKCTAFTIGDASNSCDNWIISKLRFNKTNHTDLDGTGSLFNIVKASDGFINNIIMSNIHSLVTLGTADYAASRIRFRDIDASPRLDKGGILINIVNATGFRFSMCRFTGNGTYVPASSAYRGIKFVPTGDNVIDSGIFEGLEFNYPDMSVYTVLEVDATDGIVTNQFFNNCIFDHAIDKSIHLHIDGSASTAARIANFQFTSCRAVCEDNGGPIVLDNTGNETFYDITFNGGFYNTWDEAVVRILTDQISAKFVGVRFSDAEKTTAKACISSATGDILVAGCVATPHLDVGDAAFDYGVKFTASVNGFVICDNDFEHCTIADVDTSLLNNSSGNQRVIANNMAQKNLTNFRATTTDATPTVIASWPLPQAGVYHVRAMIVGVEDGGGNRASYEIIGTYYRDGSGNVTLQGSLTTPHTVESNASWAATLVESTTAVQVRVTGVAGTTIKWGSNMQVTCVPE